MLLTGIRRESICFVFSPAQEVLRALHVFAEPRHHAEQMTWVRLARRCVTPGMKAQIKRFGPLLRPAPELFPELLPSDTASAFGSELALLARSRLHFRTAMLRRILGKRLMTRTELTAAARPSVLARIVRGAAARDPDSAPLFEAFLDSPADVLRDLCALLENFFERCLAAQWAQFETRALEDARARERLLDRFGVAGMLRTLTGHLSAGGDRRTAFLNYSEKESDGIRLELLPGTTLALMPSYFIWPHASLLVLKRDKLDVRVAYPLASPSTIRPHSRAWEQVAKRFAALSDPTRLQMLDLLCDRDLSTREFAGLLGLSEGGVSRHLSILRGAKLVTSVRDGYFVLYRRASVGFDEMLEFAERFSTTALL